MGRILNGPRAALCALTASALVCAAESRAERAPDAHRWSLEIDLVGATADTQLESWTKGGLGKLRFDADDGPLIGSRAFADYRGRVGRTWWTKVVVDYVPDGSSGIDVTEAFLDWRPVPRSRNRQQWRIGAFYPPFSLENRTAGWSSGLTISSSAINSWLAEEIRPVGAQWSMRRRLGFAGSPHELGAFAAVFYRTDPAATLLFWRGWALHDRQTRLADDLPLPTIALRGEDGSTIALVEHDLEPLQEIDGRPGFYGGVQWQYARRAALQLAYYDNRSDPAGFEDGQWGWRTRFVHGSAQVELPARFGLMAQWLHGESDWILGALPSGGLKPNSRLVSDELDARFVLLTRPIGNRHDVSIRHDAFEYRRPTRGLVADAGRAWTLAYRYRPAPRIALTIERLEIDSRRDLNPILFGASPRQLERLLQMKVTFRAGALESR